MNKKFSTLLASFLLAGGMLGSANAAISATAQAAAAELTANEEWVVDYGKYFVLERANFYYASNWAVDASSYFLTKDLSGNLVYSNDRRLEDKDAYWTIKDVTPTNDPKVDGTTIVAKVKVVNANGWVLAFDKGNADANGNLKVATSSTTAANYVDEFYVYAGSTGTCEGMLCIYDGTNEYRLGNVASPLVVGGTEFEAVAVKYDPLSGTVTGASIVDVNAVGIAEEAITAADLNAELKGAFQLNFKNYTSLEGNVFTGNLKAVPTATSATTTYYLKNSDGKYIVLDNEDVWSENTANLDGRTRSAYSGYKFKTVSEHAFAQLTDKSNAIFTFYKSYDFNNTDSLIVTLPQAQVGDGPKATSMATWSTPDNGLRVFIATVNKINYLTAIEYDKANDMLADVQDNAYPATTAGEAYEVGALAPYIELGASNLIDWTAFVGKVWNITDKDGNVLTPSIYWADIDEYEDLFAPAKQVDLSKPEGQWLLYKDNSSYYFVNRESGEKAFDNHYWGNWTIRKIGEDKYGLYWSKYAADETYTIYIKEAKDAKLGKTENGYVNFDMEEESVNGKYFSFETALGLTAYIGKDADDNVILTADASKAIEFRVKQLTHNFRDHDGYFAPDTLQHYTSFLNYNKKNEIVQDVDTLQFFHYALYENFSEKYLCYDYKAKKFKLSDYSFTGNAHERFDLVGKNFAFVVKEKEDGSYILVREYAIDYDYCDSENNHKIYNNWDNKKYTFDNVFEVNFGDNAFDADKDYNVENRVGEISEADGQAHKAYAAAQPGTLADMANLYNYNDNDRLSMEATNKAEYMTITGAQDTVKIALKAQPNFYLYEQGTFLGMEHVADADMKAAILVDTAYVRNNTYRPQYLLAMNGKHVEPVWDNHPNSPSVPHLVHPDTTYGRFLINAVDSAAAWKGTDKTNPYIWEKLGSNKYYRLVFVDGFHTADALTLHTDKGDKKIALGNNNDKVCTFAFRYVDEARESVKIETLYGVTNNGTPIRGWLKYQNNVPVVTCDYEDAHVFTVDNEVEEAPTANEGVEVSEVSVVATNGAVIVKGAAGKTVAISNILGQTIANTVVASDNATIAVPAGIVVVAVEGEEAVKVVVK